MLVFDIESYGVFPLAIETKIKTRTDLKPPSMYKVIFINDDFTTFGFVVHVLTSIFDYPEQDAQDKTREIDEAGAAVVAILPLEIAEYKSLLVQKEAAVQNFPFKVIIEKE